MQGSEECASKVLVDSAALRYLALNWELWGAGHNRDLFVKLLSEVRSHPTGLIPSDLRILCH